MTPATAEPEIRTTVVGSYPLPDWLVAQPSRQALVDATRVVFKTQEDLGVDVVADGELYRFDTDHPDTNGMIEYFIRPMSGIRSAVTRSDVEEFGRLQGMGFRSEPAGVVEGPVDEGTLNLPRDYRRARGLTSHPLKFTLTGPHMLCKTLMDHHYRSKPDLAMALGRALAKQLADLDPQVIQVDEANIPGHPDEGDWAADAINLILDAAGTRTVTKTGNDTGTGSPPGVVASPTTKPSIEKGVHICFGNYGGQSIQRGEWRKLIGFMNRLRCDHVVLEFAFRGYDELVHFRELLDPRMAIGLCVIDIKVNTVETPETVAERIGQATKILGPGRIKWVHPDCGFWMNKRSIADRKMASLVRGRDLFLGR